MMVSKEVSCNRQSRPEALRRGKSDPLMFGSSLADVFSAPAYDCRVSGQEQKPEFAVTRLRSGPREMEKAPQYPADNAILICVSLTPSAVGQWRARYDGCEVGVTRAIPFATTYIDLDCPMEMWVRGPFDYLHYSPLLSLHFSFASSGMLFEKTRTTLSSTFGISGGARLR